jgi:hypothetical protein
MVADRSTGRTRFSMLETIRQFAEEQLVTSADADAVRTAHSRYFAARETDVLALWDSPRQREAYTWFTVELANLRTACRWAADHSDLDTAAAIAAYATIIGTWADQPEPVVWAEELIEPATAVQHRRLAQLYVMAAQCYASGRIDDALRYFEAGQLAIASTGFDQVPYESEAWLGAVYTLTGQPERWVELCRNMIARDPGPHVRTHACLVLALTMCAMDEAMAASEGLLAAADTVDNPNLISWTLLAYGFAYRDADPVGARGILSRGLRIAQDSGNRQLVSHYTLGLASLATLYGDAVDAFGFLTLAIRNHYDSGSFSLMAQPLGILAILFDRLGHYEPAATVSGFAATPLTRTAYPEINTTIAHLLEVLGNEAYESFARAGENMSHAEMATYALDQIDLARARLSPKGGR